MTQSRARNLVDAAASFQHNLGLPGSSKREATAVLTLEHADNAVGSVVCSVHSDNVHVAFHCGTLPRHLDRFELRTLSVVRIGWKALVAGAAIGVAISHGAALKAMGTSRRQFVRRVLHDRDETAKRLFRL